MFFSFIILTIVFLPIILIIVGASIKKNDEKASKILLGLGLIFLLIYLVGFGYCMSSF